MPKLKTPRYVLVKSDADPNTIHLAAKMYRKKNHRLVCHTPEHPTINGYVSVALYGVAPVNCPRCLVWIDDSGLSPHELLMG